MTHSDLAAATWRKSSHSGGAQDCVEVSRDLPGVVAVRDTKDRGGPVLVFSSRDWRAFVGQVKNGTHTPRQ
jgi:Domain of unknown function (DUF397)